MARCSSGMTEQIQESTNLTMMWNVCCAWERLVNPKWARHIIETGCLNAFADEGLPKTGQAPLNKQQLLQGLLVKDTSSKAQC